MDHLVFAAPDLDEGVRHIETHLGVATSPGGRHAGHGTKNRLVGLGPKSYMEVVGVDLDQPEPNRERWFGLDTLNAPRLVTWCVAVSDLNDLIVRAKLVGLDLGESKKGSRRREDGALLEWQMTDPWAERAGGIIPFFIDWGDTDHPGISLPCSSSFCGIRAEHPDPHRVKQWCMALELDIEVSRGDHARLIATLKTPKGLVEIS